MTSIGDSRDLPAGVTVRPWRDTDFAVVQRLSAVEGWTTVVDRPDAGLAAWRNSHPALVAERDHEIIGFVRAISDGYVTTYVAELLVAPAWRGQGLGSVLLTSVQRLHPGTRLDLLAEGESGEFYRRVGFRTFAGYRRSWLEL